ncbi:FbpB family small basic protein [Oceanobacillus caeni]|uniref:FbpB family small basic protein n=1 Tax=Bacillaceae TaxID=186817 RepID=UPI0009FB6B99|nr:MULTISPECIES: FbpB family small basic protein [Bacillaceae]PZD83598.1 FbpB family small basic protein [Bacilli bacterium]MBU8791701.1 FbpB family small basic protein [Oceanobacillus caeni]MCR1836146.1 FbpB family small basic protein [Oceanobacillus caeni]MED4476141.1 FbpB family small basic protein [Oceanobacillus caeni]PZD85668.1 FbpB family small basic protein [Bacilli bacterium]
MRPKTLNFEQLVEQNKQELLDDEKRIQQIELRLEKKHKELLKSKRKRNQDEMKV